MNLKPKSKTLGRFSANTIYIKSNPNPNFATGLFRCPPPDLLHQSQFLCILRLCNASDSMKGNSAMQTFCRFFYTMHCFKANIRCLKSLPTF